MIMKISHNFEKGDNSQLIISPVYSESGHAIYICCRDHSNDDSRKKWKKKWMTGFWGGTSSCNTLSQHFANSAVVITIWFANTASYWAECCLMCFITFVKPFWHTDFDYELVRLPDLEIGLTAGVTGHQGMLTPPRHPIPLWFVRGSGSAQSSAHRFTCAHTHFLCEIILHVTVCILIFYSAEILLKRSKTQNQSINPIFRICISCGIYETGHSALYHLFT
jgi:hypothetical protein